MTPFIKHVRSTMVKKFYDENGELIALIISSRFKKNGIEFFTPDDFSQCGVYAS